MLVSKTSINYAQARGLVLDLETENQVWIFEADEDSEPLFILNTTDQGFFFHGNVYLPQRIKEELPRWMKDEKELRAMLAFVAAELTNK